MIWFRHSDPRYPFLWESTDQPGARWHAEGEGPVQYIADTPDGAWAEFLRHEEIVDPVEIQGVERDLWAVELTPEILPSSEPDLALEVLLGGLDAYPSCQTEARLLRKQGIPGLVAPSAALLPGGASGWRVERGMLHSGLQRDGRVVVLFGSQPQLVGWCACSRGHPDLRILPKVRQLTAV